MIAANADPTLQAHRDLSWHCFNRIKNAAGYHYKHLVIDCSGSQDAVESH
jgi:hypothetical protein